MDIDKIIQGFNPSQDGKNSSGGRIAPTISEIPNLFFDEILVDYKLNRDEMLILIYLYRYIWCRANNYKDYGISPVLSHGELSRVLKIPIENVYDSIKRLEDYQLISTIRSGQYFIRKYFTKINDERFGQSYNEFES